jgi:hypothetical protein
MWFAAWPVGMSVGRMLAETEVRGKCSGLSMPARRCRRETMVLVAAHRVGCGGEYLACEN